MFSPWSSSSLYGFHLLHLLGLFRTRGEPFFRDQSEFAAGIFPVAVGFTEG